MFLTCWCEIYNTGVFFLLVYNDLRLSMAFHCCSGLNKWFEFLHKVGIAFGFVLVLVLVFIGSQPRKFIRVSR